MITNNVCTKRKRSESQKKRFQNPEERRKISETLIGRKHTEDSKKKMSKSLKGRKRSEETKRNISKTQRKRFEKPENHPSWKGGISRYPGEYLESRENIRERDNHTCQLCGKFKEPNGRKLSVHHIDYNKQNSNLKNLITLCNTCNKEVESDKEIWTRIFRRKIKNIYKQIRLMERRK